ncbi:hypothetical protein [Pleurocapsa sp. PCC 7319]|uniref:hypothetical protein n=1 Tax=Pleurocapsa sp. PCC 7319 TaxID=118161 RepID=UPI000346614D|nr:hypothetical protein [Pleurocapsa sp. PCC 7319]
MKINPTCPCCSNVMLHHIDNKREYWFCRYCWQEMPDLRKVDNLQKNRRPQIVTLSANLEKLMPLISV